MQEINGDHESEDDNGLNEEDDSEE